MSPPLAIVDRMLSWSAFVIVLSITLSGCGTIREYKATQQLLLSDAVDRAIARIDFSPLANEKVYLDTRYLQFKNDSAVTTNYVTSSLRQQMVVAGCLLQDRIEDAKYVVEARVGALASDGHDINYGIPASNSMNTAASILSSAPALPAIPEVSIGRRTKDMAAAKVAVFAYDRETRTPAWQSGTSIARSEASGTWVLGAGPFQRGEIYDGTQFAGKRLGKQEEDREPKVHEEEYHRYATWDSVLVQKMINGEQLPPIAPKEEPQADAEQVHVAENSDGEAAR